MRKNTCDDCKHIRKRDPPGFTGREFKYCVCPVSAAHFARKPKDRACLKFEGRDAQDSEQDNAR